MRFEQHDTAQRTLRDHLLHRCEIAGVAAILIHRNDALLLFGDLDQVLRFAERGGERLIDDDVTAGEQTPLRNRMMRCVRRRHDDQIDLARQQVIQLTHELDVRVARIGGTVPLDDHAETQPVHGAYDGRVKDFAGETKSHETHV